MSVDTFISAVKDKRNEARELYEKELVAAFDEGGKPDWHGIAARAIDHAVAGVLDVVEEQYESIVAGAALDSEGEEVDVSLTVMAELSTLYFEEISN
ncbi:hypothetical protein PHABIO_373 [Pseudomonas phage Phabio]|uniref:Uncharacterized protein n=1 Tax=Pseudomonas phage Phabio TaxID=2006668 RepID=A0A1Y0SWP1_9CAUD|nr:hypothetical protein MZD05_gp373 [Pseudomonas phage Phabio]ARV77004.1 hypothetical protein PHABIO_373 [Pseudomonas phage Phabio]